MWTMEIVAHELCHALIHKLRTSGSLLQMVLEQNPMDAEEAICHEFGWWMEQAWRWLWKVNPDGKNATPPASETAAPAAEPSRGSDP